MTKETLIESIVPRPPIDATTTEKTATAAFGLGWFWGSDSRFGSLEGVISTQVGYAGGTKDNPTYHSLGDNTETVQITYDPTRISYETLLEVFWQSHVPAYASPRQYMSIIFYYTEEQHRLALASKESEAARLQRPIFTEIAPATHFYPAEDYHQKYYLQNSRLMAEYRAIYPDFTDLVNSTAVARVNGYLAGYGTYAQFEAELPALGLSEAGQKRLRAEIPRLEENPVGTCPAPTS